MNNIKSQKSSLIALFICIFSMIYTGFIFYPKWNKNQAEATISWDASGYYFYLPAVFIYDDIKQVAFKDSILQKYESTPSFMQGFLDEKSGNYVMKYSSGQALTMLPWFFIADTWASISEHYPRDGFSYPYQLCLGIGMFLYGILGIVLMRKLLRYYYDDHIVAVALLILTLGTNYLNYSAIEQAQTHNTLFTLYVIIMLLSRQYYIQPSKKMALLIGLCCGLATLIRPTEIISAAIPVLWGISSWRAIENRAIFLWKRYQDIILCVLAAGAIIMIQPMYWKYVSDRWVVYSYQDQGFSWLHPHIWDYCFSYRCGWLRYCPMMLLAFVGIIPLIKQRTLWIPITFLFGISFYIVTAWDVWDYGGTSGRAMIQYYPILIFPIAALAKWAWNYGVSRTLFLGVVGVFMYLNIWWTYHAHRNAVQVFHVSRWYYWHMIGKWSGTDEDLKLMDNKYVFRGTMTDIDTIYQNDFSTDTTGYHTDIDGNRKWVIHKDQQTPNQIIIPNRGIQHKWMRIYGLYTCLQRDWDVWRQPHVVYRFYKNKDIVRDGRLQITRFLMGGDTKELYFDAKLPDQWDEVHISYEHRHYAETCLVDDIKVITFNEL